MGSRGGQDAGSRQTNLQASPAVDTGERRGPFSEVGEGQSRSLSFSAEQRGPVPRGSLPAEPGGMLWGWCTLRIARSCLGDQTFRQRGPTVLARHLAIICGRRRPALCSCDWLPGPGQDCIGFRRPHSLLWLLLLSKPSKEIIPGFIDNL